MPPETVHPGKPCLRSSAPTALAYRPTRRSVALQEGQLAIGCVQCDHGMPSSTSRSRTSPRSEAARALVTLSSKPRRHAAVTQEYQADYDETRLQRENLYSVEPTRHAAMQYRVPGATACFMLCATCVICSAVLGNASDAESVCMRTVGEGCRHLR